MREKAQEGDMDTIDKRRFTGLVHYEIMYDDEDYPSYFMVTDENRQVDITDLLRWLEGKRVRITVEVVQ